MFNKTNIFCCNIILLLFCISGQFAVAEGGSKPEATPASIVEKYNSAECCIYVNKMDSLILTKGQDLQIDLSNSPSLLDLSTGPTFAALIEIPSSNKDETYTIRTYLMQSGNELFTFFPYVAILDAEFNLQGSSTFSHNYYQSKSFFLPNPYLHFEFSIDASTGSKDDIKYILVYTRAKHFTLQSNDQLKMENRNVVLKEASARLNDAIDVYVRTDTIYGLPGAEVRISHRRGFF